MKLPIESQPIVHPITAFIPAYHRGIKRKWKCCGKWSDVRRAYKIKMPNEGKSSHYRVVVWLDDGAGYRMPNMNRLTFWMS